MDYEYKDRPEQIGKRQYLPEGANCPTEVTIFRCFCGGGSVEHHRVPGFGDDWFEICCNECSKNYSEIRVEGNRWKVFTR